MATEAIRVIHEAVIEKFPDIVFGGPGIVVCRPIANTNPPQWSQHAYGNGQDYGGPPEMLEALYQYLRRNRGRLPVGTLCYKGRGGCTTPHNTILHVDGLPRMRGTPKCAGGTPAADPDYRPSRSSDNPSIGDVIVDAGRDAAGRVLPGSVGVIDFLTGATSITDPLQALSAAVVALFQPETWIRTGLAVGGAALILMGLAALLGDTVVDLAALTGGPIGAVAKVGASVGGQT